MLTLLALTLAAACRGALPNPEPVHQPAAWAAERISARDTLSGAPANARASDAPVVSDPAAAGPSALAAGKESIEISSEPSPAVRARAQAESRPAPSPAPAADGSATIARVAGEPIDAVELLRQWLHRDSFGLFQQVNHLVADRLVALETARLGLAPDEAALDKRYKEAIAEIEKEIQKKRPGMSLDRYVDGALGLDPLRYRETIRNNTQRGWLAERCVRTFLLQSEHAIVRLIAVQSEDALKAAQAELAAGTPFDEVARKHSVDPSGKQSGGLVSPVVKDNTPMGKLAFSTAAGAIGGPIYERGVWLLVRVDSRPQPLVGGWKELGAAIEKSLAERAIDDIEYKQWEAAMNSRYPIDLTPLLRLCGEPVR